MKYNLYTLSESKYFHVQGLLKWSGSSGWLSVVGTFLSKDPPLVHAGGEEDGRLGDTHQQVCDRQVNDEHVGRRPQAVSPATHTHTHTHAHTQTHTHTHTHTHKHTHKHTHTHTHMHTHKHTRKHTHTHTHTHMHTHTRTHMHKCRRRGSIKYKVTQNLYFTYFLLYIVLFSLTMFTVMHQITRKIPY